MKIFFRDCEWFKKEILKRGYSLGSFADEVGISRPYMWELANGFKHPSGRVAKKIVDTLDVDFDHIFIIKDVNKSKRKEVIK